MRALQWSGVAARALLVRYIYYIRSFGERESLWLYLDAEEVLVLPPVFTRGTLCLSAGDLVFLQVKRLAFWEYFSLSLLSSMAYIHTHTTQLRHGLARGLA